TRRYSDLEPRSAVVRQRERVEVFGHRGLTAIRHAVRPQIPGLEMRREDLQRPAGRRSRAEYAALQRLPCPRRAREALQRRLGRRSRLRKLEAARLHAGIELEEQRIVVLPLYAKAGRLANEAGRPEGLAEPALGPVPLEVPCRGLLSSA